MIKPNDATVQVWTRLLRLNKIALKRVEGILKKEKLPALSWYDILLELERAGAEGLRPYELEEVTLLPQYGVSRILEKIEKAGYLQRLTCDDDGRGQSVVITDAGLKMRQKMWSVYSAAIEEVVGTNLNEAEAATLSGLLKDLISKQS
ncbi:hypothetical protein A9Q83_03245 [Alphaproteobacteria bacterium 46_93_T64]|nr:hypothetical protein A9Q83_03245 [Alphaproteobacteria bacterium 46_93_T64]